MRPPLVRPVVQVQMGRLHRVSEGIGIRRVAVVLARDLHPPGAQVPHRMVGAVVTELQLERPPPQRQGEDLVPEADPEDRHPADEPADLSDRVIGGGGISGASAEERGLLRALESAPLVIVGDVAKAERLAHAGHVAELVVERELRGEEVAPLRMGDRIEIASPQDKAVIAVRLREAVQPGVVKVIHGHGFGRRFGSLARGKGTHINPIFETRVSPISGGIGYNECKVSIRKSEEA